MTKSPHPQIFFNSTWFLCKFSKTLRIYLDKKLCFYHHIEKKMTKTIKGVGVIKRLGRMKTASSAFSSHNI